MASKDKIVAVKALLASIAKGWKLVPTPKVRAGFKKGQQQLVQADGKTLAMLTLREKGVRVEGSRLAKNITVTDAPLAARLIWSRRRSQLPSVTRSPTLRDVRKPPG